MRRWNCSVFQMSRCNSITDTYTCPTGPIDCQSTARHGRWLCQRDPASVGVLRLQCKTTPNVVAVGEIEEARERKKKRIELIIIIFLCCNSVSAKYVKRCIHIISGNANDPISCSPWCIIITVLRLKPFHLVATVCASLTHSFTANKMNEWEREGAKYAFVVIGIEDKTNKCQNCECERARHRTRICLENYGMTKRVRATVWVHAHDYRKVYLER